MDPTPLQPPPRPRIRKLLALLLVLLPIAGFASWRAIPRSKPSIANDSVDGLKERLSGEEEDALLSQEELERRLGTGGKAFWLSVLESPSSRARSIAIDSLGKERSPETVALLTRALEDPASSVRMNAVQSLLKQQPELAVKPLLSALQDDDTWISQSAANKLATLKRPESAPLLIASLHNSDRYTAAFSMNALKHIAGLSGKQYYATIKDSDARWNATVKTWEDWWAKHRAGWPAAGPATVASPVQPARSVPAPDFRVTDDSGMDYSLSSMRGKLLIVNFWATDCGPCLVELPGLNAVAERYRNKGLVVLGLETNQHDAQMLKRFAAAHKVSFPLIHAPAEAAESYGHIHDVPVTFLIDREGRIRYEWDGDREESVFDSAVKRLIAG